MSIDKPWEAIFNKYNLDKHNFARAPYEIDSGQIKDACRHFRKTGQKEVRILCKHDTREKRPAVFKEKGLFILPVRNGVYNIVKGEGYVDIPPVTSSLAPYANKLDFPLVSSKRGNSEMQHLDFAFATGLVRAFAGDDSLVLAIRGRKYTPPFDFKVGKFSIAAEKVQTEVDGGYEGRKRIVLIEAKNTSATNTIIRQLYYPYRQWKIFTGKDVRVMFFEKRKKRGTPGEFHFWEFVFKDEKEYNSIALKRSKRYAITPQ